MLRSTPALALLCVAAASTAAACAFHSAGLATTEGTSRPGGSAGAPSSSSNSSGGGTGGAGGASSCGDGVLDVASEKCDGLDLGTATCESIGHTGGVLTCNSTCQFDETQCFDGPPDWLGAGWGYRRVITVDHTQIPVELSDFPLFLRVTEPAVVDKLQPSAADVALTLAGSKDVLAHEVERFDAPGKNLVLWVRVPKLSSTEDTKLYLYYGNPTFAGKPDAASVWVHEQAVLHLGEAVTGGQVGSVHRDSTGHGHDGIQNGNNDVNGKLGRGQSFDGASQFIDITDPAGVVLGDADCTISAWIKTNATVDMGIVTKSAGSSHVQGDKLFGVNHTAHKLGIDNGWVGYLSGTATIDDDKWHLVAWTQKKDTSGTSETWDLWVDGVHETSTTQDTKVDDPAWTLRIAWPTSGSYFASFFKGAIDEVRISDVARDGNWLLTSYRSQNNPAGFSTLGPEEALEP